MSSGTTYSAPDEPVDPAAVGAAGARSGWDTDVFGAAQAGWGLVVLGALSIVLGALAVFWPSATVSVIAVLFGIQLLCYGVVRIVDALATDEANVGARILLALLGLLSVVVGVLCLRHPLQTVTVLALILGLFWLVGGLIEVIRTMTDRAPGRGLGVLIGVLAALVGVVVLAWPQPTVLVLTLLLGIWLVVSGVLMVAAGVRARRYAAAA